VAANAGQAQVVKYLLEEGEDKPNERKNINQAIQISVYGGDIRPECKEACELFDQRRTWMGFCSDIQKMAEETSNLVKYMRDVEAPTPSKVKREQLSQSVEIIKRNAIEMLQLLGASAEKSSPRA